MNLRELFVSLGLEWDSAGFAEAMVATDLLKKGAELLVDAFKAIPAALIDATEVTAEYGSHVNDTSLATGIAVQSLQELEYAFGLGGVSAEAMSGAVIRLGHTMGEAVGGNKEAAKGFRDLGVKVTGADGQLRGADETLVDLIDKLGAIENPAERSAKGMQVFGRAYKELAPIIAAGGDSLRAQIALFQRLDLAMSEEQVAAADTFGDSMDTISRIVLAFKTDIGSVLIDGLQPMVDGLIEWVAANRQVIKSGLQTFGRVVVKTLKTMVTVLKVLIENWKLIAFVIGSALFSALVIANGGFLMLLTNVLLSGAAMAAFGAISVAAAIKAALAWVAAAAPVVLLVALFGLLLLAVEDVYVFLHGGDSVIGDLGKKWTKFLDEWLADDAGDGWLMTALKAVIWLITDITKRFPEAIAEWKQKFIDFFVNDIPKIMQRVVMNFPPFLRGALGVVGAPALGVWANAASSIAPGGAAGPTAAGASAAAANKPQVFAPTLNAGGFSIVAQPGQDTAAIGDHVRDTMTDWWGTETSKLAASAGGG